MTELSPMEKAFDEMSWDEVVCRLPGPFALGSVKRRVKDLVGLKSLLEAQDAGGAIKVKELRDHVNQLVRSHSVSEVIKTFSSGYHQTLFSWLDTENRTKFYDQGKDELTIEFNFNLVKDSDIDGLKYVLNRVLNSETLEIEKISAILRKADPSVFDRLCDIVLKDTRPEVRVSLLSVAGQNSRSISDHQKVLALKSLAKLPSSSGSKYINVLDFNLFHQLKPLERVMALDKYLDYFPLFKKARVFNPMPDLEDIKSQLFSTCFEFTDLVEGIIDKYNKITVLDPPEEKEEEE